MLKRTLTYPAAAILVMTIAWQSTALANDFSEAMTSAYSTNPRIKAQRKVLEQSHEEVSQALAGFRPSVTAQYQRGRQKVSFDNSPKEATDVDNRTLNLNQPIFLGGRNFYSYYSSKDSMKAERNNLESVVQEVLLDAVVAYMDVVQNYSVLELSRNNVKVLSKQLDASRDRFSVGDVTRTDVAQSEARLARAVSDKIQAEADLDASKARFERVIGYMPENLPLALPRSIPPLPPTLEQAVDEALENNPNIGAFFYAKEAAKDGVKVATSRLLPQVSLRGLISRQDGAGAFGNSRFETDQLLVNVDLPLYQNGSEYSQVRAAELQEQQREFELLNARDQARESVIQAWEQLEAAIATIEAQQEQVESAQVALDGVRQENQYGSRTVLDVLDAEQELFVAQVELVRAQRNRYVALFNLMLVLGRLDVGTLELDVPVYDPQEHFQDVKWQLVGF